VQHTTGNTFSKQERLCSKNLIEDLFKKGSSVSAYPVRFIFLTAGLTGNYPAQTMFVVPKKKFKRAHDRNLIRRRMKEAFRLNKHVLYDKLNGAGRRIALAVIYTAAKEEKYPVIEKSIVSAIGKVK
jgi:ribonuclease P protein component